ncbi:MAG TPA: anhydro-N-acetylmuramic acid kinase [Terriglobales bacterium]|nr:anhydro-N-acetylmuramic acid kinase [Terriglobales bacterium]
MIVAGVMSGTSADGVDVAVVDIGRTYRTRLLATRHTAYTARERSAVLDACSSRSSPAEIARLDVALGRRIAAAVIAARGSQPLDIIACHGQTVFHHGRVATLQLGDAATIAARTGVAVVSDFRSADIAQGGEGAPLVPFADYQWFRHRRRYRVCLNLGGIANLTLIPPAAKLGDVTGFDTGPGNMALDGLMARITKGRKRYDAAGGLAAKGTVNRKLLGRLLAHPFIRRRPPKSAGREQFGEAFLAALPDLPPPDLMATLVAFTAQSVARSLPASADVIVSGGGVHNRTLMEALRQAAPHCAWRTSGGFGVPTQAKEAMAFAVLGAAHLRRHPANLPRVTGARRAVILGAYTPAGK